MFEAMVSSQAADAAVLLCDVFWYSNSPAGGILAMTVLYLFIYRIKINAVWIKNMFVYRIVTNVVCALYISKH